MGARDNVVQTQLANGSLVAAVLTLVIVAREKVFAIEAGRSGWEFVVSR